MAQDIVENILIVALLIFTFFLCAHKLCKDSGSPVRTVPSEDLRQVRQAMAQRRAQAAQQAGIEFSAYHYDGNNGVVDSSTNNNNINTTTNGLDSGIDMQLRQIERMEEVEKKLYVKKLDQNGETVQTIQSILAVARAATTTSSSSSGGGHSNSNSSGAAGGNHQDSFNNESSQRGEGGNILSQAWNSVQSSLPGQNNSGRGQPVAPECAICLDRYEIGETVCWAKTDECDHIFHKECMIVWMAQHDDCPLCRTDIMSFQESSSENPGTSTIIQTNV